MIKLVEDNPDKYEVRIGYYGGLVLTSEMIKCVKFDIEMKQHYQEEREKIELLIYAMKHGLWE